MAMKRKNKILNENKKRNKSEGKSVKKLQEKIMKNNSRKYLRRV